MRCRHFFAALFAIPLGVAAAEPTIADFAWLTGCWGAENAEPGSVEQWTPLAGETMLGTSRTIKNGKTVAYEFMRLWVNAEGRVVFSALPSGRPETAFPLRDIVDGNAVFENLAHGFPERVMYRKLPDARLFARIEGLRNGVLRGVDFPMRRVACDAPLKP